jgi:N-hydroxyarylamine O-acetyltransferase
MATFKFDRNAYLQRINYSGKTTPTLRTLKALHHAQLYTIPFENFDIQLGRGIDLAPGTIFKKLVRQMRGGYCFELNGLFLTALQAFGFDVRPLLARVHITGTPSGRGHQLALVTIEGEQWIADVGFGADTPRTPIPLGLDHPASHDGQTVRLVKSDPWGIMLQALVADQWMDRYSFDLGHVCQADIDYGNHFASTHPRSLFVFTRVAALPVEQGVLTLFNNTFKRSIAGRDKVTELEEGRPYLNALKAHFGIELGAPYESLRPLPEV